MRATLCGISLLTLAACGVDETVFIPDYADYYCQSVMDCTDPAVLTFDGIGSMDDCLAIVGPDLEAEVGYCDYNGKAAKKCLQAMETMGCPGVDQTVDDILPLDCAQVLSACSPPKDDPTGGTTGGTTTTGGSGA